MNDWKKYKIGELASFNRNTLKSNFNFDEIEYLDTGSIVQGKIEHFQRIKTSEAPSRAKRLLNDDDIVYSTVRPIQRHYGIIKGAKPNSVASTGFAVLSCNKSLVNPKYIYYFLIQDDIVNYLDSVAEGSTSAYPSLTPDVIANLEINLPNIKEQNKIVVILSSLDDKIDLLHRQNKTLEQLTETLFRQWFIEEVDESTPQINLSQLVDFDPAEKIFKAEEYRFFDMKCLSNETMSISDGIRRKVNSGSNFRNGDTLLAKITPCLENGKTGFVMQLEENEIGRGSTEFIVMRSKNEVSPYWVYCLARSNEFRDSAILSMTGTSGRQRVQINVLKEYKICFNKSIMIQFHNLVRSLFNKINVNQEQINALSKLKEEILPKLMMEEIELN